MAVISIWAGASASNMTMLPSPVSVDSTSELIWSENTGRAQDGANRAKMIGDTVGIKMTHNIKWGVLTSTELSTIKSKLTGGFFYFGVSTNGSAPSSPAKYYRSEISYAMVQAGSSVYYKDASVSVIEQ